MIFQLRSRCGNRPQCEIHPTSAMFGVGSLSFFRCGSCVGADCYIKMAILYHQTSEYELVGGWKWIFGQKTGRARIAGIKRSTTEICWCQKDRNFGSVAGVNIVLAQNGLFWPFFGPKGANNVVPTLRYRFLKLTNKDRCTGWPKLLWLCVQLPQKNPKNVILG